KLLVMGDQRTAYKYMDGLQPDTLHPNSQMDYRSQRLSTKQKYEFPMDTEQVIPHDGERIHSQGDLLWFSSTLPTDSGNYICRNTSYCITSTLSITVYEEKGYSLDDIAYVKNAIASSTGKINCPNLEEYKKRAGRLDLKWYKVYDHKLNCLIFQDSNPLSGEHFLLIKNVDPQDQGYYTCKLTFYVNSTQYKVTRTISLQILGKSPTPSLEIMGPASLLYGSSLIIPCKVSTQPQTTSATKVTWSANGVIIEDSYDDKRIFQGPQFISSNNGDSYVEIDLIFDEVREEDTNTEFKCIAVNFAGSDETVVHIKLEGEKTLFRERQAFLTFLIMCNYLLHVVEILHLCLLTSDFPPSHLETSKMMWFFVFTRLCLLCNLANKSSDSAQNIILHI
uniref:Interleukin 1 receptor type 2 n=1 Tax=Erpetoichthys calabaricus TaxID=27687 RepID=A0A8C4X5G4_ERPCA